MSKLSDYANAILQGGLPAALDMGLAAAGAKQGDTKPEQTAPAAGVKDRDTSTTVAAANAASPLAWFDAKTAFIGVAGLIVVSAVLVLSFKALGRK